MKAALLDNRGIIEISGPDAADWLQGLITNDIGKADANETCFAALLSPQGKILFDFMIHRQSAADGPVYFIDCAADQCPALAKRLALYRMRAKVQIADRLQQLAVLAIWDTDNPGDENARRDSRHPALGWRLVCEKEALPEAFAQLETSSAYHSLRVTCGVPEGGRDFSWGEIFPHDANMDELGGIDFQKGCYIGQEVVSRVQHRGSARKRFRKVGFAAGTPREGSPIVAGETELGAIASIAGQEALALIRTDRATASTAAGERPSADGIALEIKLER